MRRLAAYRPHILLFVLGLVVYGAVAGPRLAEQSANPHFVYQADAWLSGQLSLDEHPPGADDPAVVERVLLEDGRKVRGRSLRTSDAFLTTGGETVPADKVREELDETYYVSFPPLPAVLMIPQVAVRGTSANDVVPSVLVAALILPLAFAALRRLAAEGISKRTPREDAFVTVALGFGTVLFFTAAQGSVWFTAHVVGVALAFAYLYCSVGARYPILAGLCLGFAAVTRTPMAFMFPLFLFEAWRVCGGRDDLRAVAKTCLAFAAPIAVIAVVAMAHNAARFDALTEFGHSYLRVRQQAQIEEQGLFDWSYLSRNLAALTALLPALSTESPYVTISGHGVALWMTTPLFVFLLWPKARGALHMSLWVTVVCVALPSLLYQNSGWVQFGQRFSLDYTPFLFALLAIGQRPFRWPAKTLVAAAIAINLYGAITFGRVWEVYDTSPEAYECVIPH